MSTRSHDKTLRLIKDQNPPIVPGMRWRIEDPEREGDKRIVLELRVVARYFDTYPDGKDAQANGTGYLVMERCGGTVGRREGGGDFALERLPEYNLRRLFEPFYCLCGEAHADPKEEGVCEVALGRILSHG